VGPGVEKQEWFDREWPVIRRLVVRPEYRGLGIGRALTDECVRRARRDHATLIALHTTPILDVAFGMYTRMGFTFFRESPPRGGVPYGIYVKQLR
jgi:ribosomal protein S18 acetylase RimI-like enzyme